jgi:uncharacterized protein YjbJ (UPF0337 family)
MDKDTIQGAVDQTKGAIKDAIGKGIGDKKLQIEGAMDKLTGKIESNIGDAKVSLRDAANKSVQ